MLKLPESLKIVFNAYNAIAFFADNSGIILLSVYAAGSILTALVLLTTARHFSSHPKHLHANEPSESLQALTSVLIPTCASWPREYADCLDHSISINSKTINYSLTKLFAGICLGDIEIRDLRDLPCLLNGPIRTYGWNINLTVDFPCRFKVLRWIMTSQASASMVCPSQSIYINTPTQIHQRRLGNLGNRPARTLKQPIEDVLVTDNVEFHDVFLSNAFKKIGLSTCLDFVPYAELDPTFRTMLHFLRPGNTASFEFTTVSSKIPFLGNQYIFCSYPFMPGRFTPTSKVSCRTSTPLLTSLQKILEILGTLTTTIEAVSNITAESTNILQLLEQELTTNSTLRSAIVCRWGLEGWKEYRFKLAWEAALLQAGCLAKWSVTIRK